MCMSFHVDKNALLYFISKTRKKQYTKEIAIKCSKSLAMYGDMFPKELITVLAPDKDGKTAVFSMIWGFTHEASSTPLVNCRVETADRRNMWKDSWNKRRCIIPVSWYYEWGYPVYEDDNRTMHEYRNTKKIKFAIQPEGSEVSYIAGLYRFEEHNGIQVPMFSILTRDSVGAVRDIHDRMPVILEKDSIREWIRPNGNPSHVVKKAVTNMVIEKAVEYHPPALDFVTA